MDKLSNFDFKNLISETFSMKEKKVLKEYINVPFSIDIETTSTTNANGEEIAFPYIFQLGINCKAYYTRSQTELKNFLDNVSIYLRSQGLHIICLIHNLSFEFCFLSNFLDFKNIFATDFNKVIKCTYKNIDFRCSYIQSNCSLANLAKNYCKTQKLVGDLDYKKVRTPETPLTQKEIAYCENDVIILNEYWNYYITPTYINNTKNGIVWIPLTHTSKTRKLVRNHIKDNAKLLKAIQKTKPNEVVQNLLQKAFSGGYTHANIMYSNVILHDVKSYDLTSSYPAVMLYGKYPMTKFTKTKISKITEMDKNHAYLFDIEFLNLKPKSTTHIISLSKCEKTKNVVVDNGRIISADYLKTTITDIDLETINKFYSYEKYRITNCYKSLYGYLPKYLTDTIIEVFEKKLLLKPKVKQNPNDEYLASEYLRVKQSINSMYGMSVTAPVHDEIEYTEGLWKRTKTEYNRNATYSDFLLFQWGVWVTSHARNVLLTAVEKLGNDIIYCDTDSCKFVGNHDNIFSQLNIEINNKLKSCLGSDFERVKSIGLWDYEGQCKEFITLGAKKYCWDSEPTVSGISKKSIIKECERLNINMCEYFKNGFTIDKNHTNKNTVKYHWGNKKEPVIYTYKYNGQTKTINCVNFIYMTETTFKMDMTKDYIALSEKFKNTY